MSITFTAEQDELRAEVRKFLAERSPSSEVRRLIDDETGSDPATWSTLSRQLGLTGLAVAEEYGGAGFGPVELGVVLEEMGAALLSGPFFATVALAGQALAVAGTAEARARWLPGIADGSLTATLAVAEESAGWALEDVHTRAESSGPAWALTGTKTFVVDGHSAALVLVLARTGDGVGVFAVEGDAAGVRSRRLQTLDTTRRLARIDLDGAPAVRVDAPGADLERVLDLVLVASAAEQLGGAQRCLDTAVDYARIRVQFDRPIGSFQAIKHKAADMLLALESSRSGVYYAMSVAADGPADELGAAAALAKAWTSDAFAYIARENVQIHGGIGYTWEHDAHLYLKRAKSAQLLFGTPESHRERLADLVGI